MSGGFTHFDESGNAIMVDVSGKEPTARRALARGRITMSARALAAVIEGAAKKGDVLAVARVAGICAAKRASDLIPLCHPIALDKCAVDFAIDRESSSIEATCETGIRARTGAEMEALAGVSAALLTIYDMCKAIDRAMEIGAIRLVEKSGGSSGRFENAAR